MINNNYNECVSVGFAGVIFLVNLKPHIQNMIPSRPTTELNEEKKQKH